MVFWGGPLGDVDRSVVKYVNSWLVIVNVFHYRMDQTTEWISQSKTR